MIPQRWCSVTGNSWTTTAGSIVAKVHLMHDEFTYRAYLSPPNGESDFFGDFDTLKQAKDACLIAMDNYIGQEFPS